MDRKKQRMNGSQRKRNNRKREMKDKDGNKTERHQMSYNKKDRLE